MRLALLVAALQLLACSRSAEIEDAPQGSVASTSQVPKPEGGVPVVEGALLDNAEGLTCAERPTQAACVGTNDFPCDFTRWLKQLSQTCQTETDCHTDRWLEVVVGADGCASELRMEDPDAPYVACMSDALSRYHCPCANVIGATFLGLSHDGCTVPTTCGTGEFRCPKGSHCQEDECVADAAAGGGGG